MSDPEREPVDENQLSKECQAYLAKIRETVKRSEALIETAELRIAETDRFLAEQGLTRDDLKKLLENYPLTPEQRKQIDEELARLDAELQAELEVTRAQYKSTPEEFQAEDDTEHRSRKLKNLMNPFRL